MIPGRNGPGSQPGPSRELTTRTTLKTEQEECIYVYHCCKARRRRPAD